MNRYWRKCQSLCAVAALAGALTACTLPQRPPAPPPSAPERGAAPAGADAQRLYRIDPAQSLVQILVYRGGTLARLGHNHVIAARGLTGAVQWRPALVGSTIELHFPVTEWTVDEPALRAGRGPEFPPEVPESARQATRQNMLSAAMLDAATYADIRVRGVATARDGAVLRLALTIDLRGGSYALEVPVQLRSDGEALEARGRFPLLQSQLGLTPMTTMLGALRVEDRLEVEFTVIARGPAR